MLLLGVALLLVLGISRLLSTGGSGDPQQTAATVGGSPTASTDTTPTASATADTSASATPVEKKRKKQPLPRPDGPCEPADLVVTPLVREAHAGDPIKVVLRVTTHETPACTWQVSPEDLFVTIADADATIWSSQQCPAVLPDEQIVPRQEKAARTSFLWNGKASDASCSAATEWAVDGPLPRRARSRGERSSRRSRRSSSGRRRGRPSPGPRRRPPPRRPPRPRRAGRRRRRRTARTAEPGRTPARDRQT